MTKFKLMSIDSCSSIMYRRDHGNIPCRYLESFYEHCHTDMGSVLVWHWEDKDLLDNLCECDFFGFCCHPESLKLKEKLTGLKSQDIPEDLKISEYTRELLNTCASITEEDNESDFPAWCPLQDYDDGEE